MHTAQFANSFSTGIAPIESVCENASRMFPFSVRWPVNTGFPGFSAKSAVIDGGMLGAAMHGCAVHSLATHHCGASHTTLSLGFLPARRNPAAPPEAFPPASEATFSVANANSFSTDKPTEGPVAGRAFRKAFPWCRSTLRGLPAGGRKHAARDGSPGPSQKLCTQTYPQHAHSA